MEPITKGILKKKADHVKTEGTLLKWDECTIAEHNKERGGKMKITEPKTPYEYYELEREEETEKLTEQNTLMNQVVTRLEKHQDTAEEMDTCYPEYEYVDEEEEKETEAERKRHEDFKKRQKMHYKNEYAKAHMITRRYEAGEEDI